MSSWAEYAQEFPVEENIPGRFGADYLDPVQFRCEKRSKGEVMEHFGDSYKALAVNCGIFIQGIEE